MGMDIGLNDWRFRMQKRVVLWILRHFLSLLGLGSFNAMQVIWWCSHVIFNSGKYVVFNGILQFIVYTKEKNAILFTYPPAVSYFNFWNNPGFKPICMLMNAIESINIMIMYDSHALAFFFPVMFIWLLFGVSEYYQLKKPRSSMSFGNAIHFLFCHSSILRGERNTRGLKVWRGTQWCLVSC